MVDEFKKKKKKATQFQHWGFIICVANCMTHQDREKKEKRGTNDAELQRG